MQGNKNTKIGDACVNPQNGRTYYYDGLNYVEPLCFEYKNYNNKKAERTVVPIASFYGTTDFYSQKQWLLQCWDCDRQDYRTFAFSNIVRFL